MTRTLKETRMLEALEKVASEQPERDGWPVFRPVCYRCRVTSDQTPFPHRADCPVLICSNACADIRELDEREGRR